MTSDELRREALKAWFNDPDDPDIEELMELPKLSFEKYPITLGPSQPYIGPTVTDLRLPNIDFEDRFD